jgi:hypothetical protein
MHPLALQCTASAGGGTLECGDLRIPNSSVHVHADAVVWRPFHFFSDDQGRSHPDQKVRLPTTTDQKNPSFFGE